MSRVVDSAATSGMGTASTIHHRSSIANCIVLSGLSGFHVITAYVLIQTEAGKAAVVAAALRDLPGVLETACLAGPYDVVAYAQAPDIDELAKLVTSQVQVLDGVRRTLSCPVVHL